MVQSESRVDGRRHCEPSSCLDGGSMASRSRLGVQLSFNSVEAHAV